MNLRSILLLLSFVIATPVAAQGKDPGEVAYQAGRKAYDLREWDKAIENFKEAYRIRSDAPSLFNIAQSYRLKGDCVEALGFYKTYKRNFSTAPNLAAVDKFIAELEPCAKERASKQPAPDPQQPPAQPTQPETKPDEARQPPMPPSNKPGAGKRMAGIITASAGVALVGTGFAFGMIAKSKANDVTNGGDPNNPPEFDDKLEKSGKRFDLFAKISWGVGGAAIVGGVVLYVMGRSTPETRFAIAPTSGGGMLAWGRDF